MKGGLICLKIAYYDSLEHYGVPGMKWGVRKEEDRVRTLKKRVSYSTSTTKKNKHRLELEKKYRSQGMTQKEAELAASKRIRMERIIAGSAAVSLASVGAYVAYNKYSNEYIDKTLKSGTKLQTLTSAVIKHPGLHLSDRTIKDLDAIGDKAFDFFDRQRFYASYKDKDNRKYLENLGGSYLKDHAVFRSVTTSLTKDAKIASRDTASKAFASLYKDDSSFRAAIDSSLFRALQTKGITDKQFKALRLGMKQIAKGKIDKTVYDAFNIALADKNPAFTPYSKKFYDMLKAQGYSAIQDINDMKYSAYKSKNPLIIFDMDSAKLDNVDTLWSEKLSRLLSDNKTKKGLSFISGRKVA